MAHAFSVTSTPVWHKFLKHLTEARWLDHGIYHAPIGRAVIKSGQMEAGASISVPGYPGMPAGYHHDCSCSCGMQRARARAHEQLQVVAIIVNGIIMGIMVARILLPLAIGIAIGIATDQLPHGGHGPRPFTLINGGQTPAVAWASCTVVPG